MPTSSKRKLPPGMLSAAVRTKVGKSITGQREALLAAHGKATELLPRKDKRFFSSIDATNVDDKSLLKLSLEDLPKDTAFAVDGGRGTNRRTVQQYLKDRLARAAQQKDSDANEEEKAKLREEGAFPYELPGLSDEARKAAWRKLLVIPGSFDLAMGKEEFVKRAGGSGSNFWDCLYRERKDAKVAKAKASGEVKTSIRERTYTAS